MTSQQTREDTKQKEEIVYKFSNKGSGQLREAVIIEGKPYFIKYYCNEENGKRFIQVEPTITEFTPNLRPPQAQEYPYNPYEFKTTEEPQIYLQWALKETPDSLLTKIKTQVKRYNDIDDKTASLLSADIFGSYFQDRFSTVHYLMIVGANGTGKSAFGDTFESLGYRAVNVTNATESFWFRMFGTFEYGQATIIVEEFDKMDENSQLMGMLKVGYQPNAKVPRMDYEIMKILGIPNSTFYRYKSKIYKEDKELLSKIMIEPLESRMLKLMRCLEDSSRIFRQIMEDDKAKPMDRIRASKKMVNAQYNILRLLKMGPNFYYYELF